MSQFGQYRHTRSRPSRQALYGQLLYSAQNHAPALPPTFEKLLTLILSSMEFIQYMHLWSL